MKALIWFICSVCIYDIYCTVKYSDYLMQYERNHIAKLLITETKEVDMLFGVSKHGETLFLDSDVDVSLLVAVKCVGLLIAMEILEWVERSKKHYGRVIICAVAIIQAALLLYLIV